MSRDAEHPSPARPATIALFGGSFNPPHIAHVLVAGWALAGGEIDAVWIIPSGGHPFGKPLEPFAHRHAMCRLAFACYGRRVSVLDIEAEPRVHYSIDTLRVLGALHPEMRWRWLMGSDQLADAPKWKAFEELSRLAPPLVIPRAGRNPPASPRLSAGFALPDISSTLVRDRIAADPHGEELPALVPVPVLDYIREHGLYRSAARPPQPAK